MISPLSTTSVSLFQSVDRPSSRPDAPPSEPQEEARADPVGPESPARTADQQGPDGLTTEERRIIAELTSTDRAVRAHEQAHLAAAGGLARGVSFTFVTGPDGKQYAVGGEVSIDTSPVSGNPEATIRKAQQVRAAANAPANPSGQDRAVASQAAQMEQIARQQIAEQRRQEQEEQVRTSQVRAFDQDGSSSAGSLISLLA